METRKDNASGIRKRIIGKDQLRPVGEVPTWLRLEELAEVEVSSEDPAHPVEHALLPQHDQGWRAAGPGKQIIRLLFDQPQTIHRIYLHFTETERERTQEFVLRWAQDPAGEREEIVRQRWNFSPSGSVHEIEDYRVPPRAITLLELEIVPAIDGGDSLATLQQFLLS